MHRIIYLLDGMIIGIKILRTLVIFYNFERKKNMLKQVLGWK